MRPLSMRTEGSSRIIVIGDIHGCLDSLLRVLSLAEVIDEEGRWCGGQHAQLVVCGDMVDEGASSRQVLQLLRSWQAQAGEQVTVLMGNHELLFLQALAGRPDLLAWETVWSWAECEPRLLALLTRHAIPRLTTAAMRRSLQQTFLTTGSAQYPEEYTGACQGVPHAVAVQAAEIIGALLTSDGTWQWLRRLPVADRIGEWGFFHGGPPSDFDGGIAELNKAFSASLHAGQWLDPLLEPYRAGRSPVATRGWMDHGEEAVDELLAPFGVSRVAFGHSPGALNGIFGRLDQRWGKVFLADTYFSLGTEGFLEIMDSSVWAVYTDPGRRAFQRVHPTQPPLAARELLWAK